MSAPFPHASTLHSAKHGVASVQNTLAELICFNGISTALRACDTKSMLRANEEAETGNENFSLSKFMFDVDSTDGTLVKWGKVVFGLIVHLFVLSLTVALVHANTKDNPMHMWIMIAVIICSLVFPNLTFLLCIAALGAQKSGISGIFTAYPKYVEHAATYTF